MRSAVALLIVTVLLVSGFLFTEPAHGQYSPNVPQFSLKLDNESYDVPATATSPAYHVTKDFIDVVIQNDNSYSFYAVVNESLVKLYYNIRVKDHSQSWSNCTVSPNLAPSNSNYTIVKFGLGSVNPDPGGFSIWIGNITNGNEVDFQVQGAEGFYTKLTQENPPCWRLPQFSIFNETGASGWSDTQTISASATAETEAASLTAAPTSTANSLANGIGSTALIFGAAATLFAVSAAIIVYFRRPRKHEHHPVSSEASRMTSTYACGEE
jgi:hypothetical protein